MDSSSMEIRDKDDAGSDAGNCQQRDTRFCIRNVGELIAVEG